jgi:hypothetical protein
MISSTYKTWSHAVQQKIYFLFDLGHLAGYIPRFFVTQDQRVANAPAPAIHSLEGLGRAPLGASIADFTESFVAAQVS